MEEEIIQMIRDLENNLFETCEEKYSNYFHKPIVTKDSDSIKGLYCISLHGFNLLGVSFDQVIINEYKPGNGINYHIDHQVLFGPIIDCITTGQAVPVHFKLNDEIRWVNVAADSMYIMSGDARNLWQYYLKDNGSQNRYSITYRTVN